MLITKYNEINKLSSEILSFFDKPWIMSSSAFEILESLSQEIQILYWKESAEMRA